MHKYKNLLVVLFIAFAVLGCENIPFLQTKPKKTTKAKLPVGKDVVAIIGDFHITATDLTKEIENYNALVTAQGMVKNKIDNRDKKLAYLRNEVVRKYMLYREALDRGLDKNRDILRELEYTKINLLVTELVRAELNKIEVNAQEIEDFYKQNKELLKEPEQRKILEILAQTEDEAKQVYIELLKGTDFATLARQYSKSPTASGGGDMGFIALEMDPQKRVRFDKFYEVAFSPSLEVGGTSSIFKGPDGYYIIKLENIKRSEAKSLPELQDNIKSWLLFEKQQKAISDLANKLAGETKVQIHEERVE